MFLTGIFFYCTDSNQKCRAEGDEPPMKIAKILEPSKILELPNKIHDDSDKFKRDNLKVEPLEVVNLDNEKKDTHLTQSPKHSATDAPKPEELIKALQGLENAASCDAAVRERISKFPAEISDMSFLTKISGKLEFF